MLSNFVRMDESVTSLFRTTYPEKPRTFDQSINNTELNLGFYHPKRKQPSKITLSVQEWQFFWFP